MNSYRLRAQLGIACLLLLWLVRISTQGTSGSHLAQSVPELHIDGHFGGSVTSVLPDGDHVYAAVGPRVIVLETGGEGAPVQLAASSPLPGNVTALGQAGGYVLAAFGARYIDDPSGLAVLDVRGAAEAPTVGLLHFDGLPVALWSRGSQVLVLTRHETPDTGPLATATVLRRESGGEAEGTQAQIDALDEYQGGELLSIDLGDPSTPSIVGRLSMRQTPITMKGESNQLLILAAHAEQGSQLLAMDVSDYALPKPIGSITLGGDASPDCGLDVAGGFAYAAIGELDPGLVVVDVRDAGQMQKVTNLMSIGHGITVDGRYAYAIDPATTFVFDISDPGNLTPVGPIPGQLRQIFIDGDRILTVEDGFDDNPQFSGNRAAVGFYERGAEPTDLDRVGQWSSLVDVTSLAVADDQVFATVATEFLITIDATNPQGLKTVGATRWAEGGWSLTNTQMAVGDDTLVMTAPGSSPSTLYLATRHGLEPPQPTTSLRLSSRAAGMDTRGSLVAIAAVPPIRRGPGSDPVPEDKGLRLYDVSDPSRIEPVGHFAMKSSPVGVVLNDVAAYVAASDGLHVFDITQPRLPQETGMLEDVSSRSGYAAPMMALHENRLAVVVTDGVRLFDVSDPLDPTDVGLVPAQGVRNVALAPSWLYALVDTDRRAGVVYAYSLVDIDAEPAAQFVPPSEGVTLENWGERVVVATDASGLYWLGVDEFVAPPTACECLYLPVLSRH